MINNDKKKVSIIIGSNRSFFIENAIKSVFSQTFKDYEIIVIDGDIENKTKKILDTYISNGLIRYYQKENEGPGAARNLGLKMSQGEYIAILDDDDEWIDKDKIKKQVEFLEKNRDYILVGTFAKIKDINDKVFGICRMPITDTQIRNRILSKNCFLHSTIVFRKSLIDKIGFYEEKNRIEDYLLCLKSGLFGKFINLDCVSVSLTIHPGSITAQNRIKQARDIFITIFSYRNKYPNFFIGLLISLSRLIFFTTIFYFPISKSFIYKLQNFYKKI